MLRSTSGVRWWNTAAHGSSPCMHIQDSASIRVVRAGGDGHAPTLCMKVTATAMERRQSLSGCETHNTSTSHGGSCWRPQTCCRTMPCGRSLRRQVDAHIRLPQLELPDSSKGVALITLPPGQQRQLRTHLFQVCRSCLGYCFCIVKHISDAHFGQLPTVSRLDVHVVHEICSGAQSGCGCWICRPTTAAAGS